MGSIYEFDKPIVVIVKHQIRDSIWQVIKKCSFYHEEVLAEYKTFEQAKEYRESYLKSQAEIAQ